MGISGSRSRLNNVLEKAARRAKKETAHLPDTEHQTAVQWPLQCMIGPGMEGAVACETKIGYVNGAKGQLVYGGIDVFDLCVHSTFEETSYLLLHQRLPTAAEMTKFEQTLTRFRPLPHTIRRLMSLPIEEINPMAALRMGSNFMRQRLTWRDSVQAEPDGAPLAADEDSIPVESPAKGARHALYELGKPKYVRPKGVRAATDDAVSLQSCIHLVSGMATLAAAITRIRDDRLPIDPDPDLGHAANFLYMMTGRRPSPEETRAMDVALILHADHGMNASTFASMVVASTLSDIYFSIGAGIGALNGPLHGGANREALEMLETIGRPSHVKAWFEAQMRDKKKIPGFGHRVYKAYDPRARILAPMVEALAQSKPEIRNLYETARELEDRVVGTLGREKNIFPNVDFYSGLLYRCLDIPAPMFPCLFAVSRVAGWTARVLEYLRNNRIFRPRAVYIGDIHRAYVPLRKRSAGRHANGKSAT
jgi:citrate synthase